MAQEAEKKNYPIPSILIILRRVDLKFCKKMEFVDREEDMEDMNIWVAVSNGDVDMVKQLLATGVSPNAQDEHGYSPL